MGNNEADAEQVRMDQVVKVIIHASDGDVVYEVRLDELLDTLDELCPGWHPSEISYSFPGQEDMSDITTIGNMRKWSDD